MDSVELEIRFDLPTDAPRRVPACPDCGSSSVVPIAYGLPAAETSERARRGEIVLGGCCLQEPRWYCRECLNRWPEETEGLGKALIGAGCGHYSIAGLQGLVPCWRYG